MFSFQVGQYYNLPGFATPLRFEYKNQATGELVFLFTGDGTLRFFHSEEINLEEVSYAIHSPE